MKNFEREVEVNFSRFTSSYVSTFQKISKDLDSHKEKFLESYRRIVSLQAWRSELLETALSSESLAFFTEAQNDALTSHVLASFGSWRAALNALRGCIENVLSCLFYKDHPIELQLWHSGSHKLGFSALEAYFRAHPGLAGLPLHSCGLDILPVEYSTLSKAVHASAKSFRMTVDSIGPQLWSSDVSRLGAWGTRERSTLVAINLLIMGLFRNELQGARVPNLRKALSLLIPVSRHPQIKTELGISLFPRAKR